MPIAPCVKGTRSFCIISIEGARLTSLQSISFGQRDRFAVDEYRIDGKEKVSGRTLYAADIKRDGALWAAFVESPFAHATVRSIDVRPALEIAGVHAVLTAGDIGHRRFGRQLCDWPILASGTVRFIGDRVAAVAAETREAAAEAARAVIVTYDELPALLDTVASLRPDAPALHPDASTYDYLGAHDERAPRSHHNIYGAKRIAHGDAEIDTIFANAFRVFEHSFETPRQLAGFVEPRATLVWIDGDIVHLHSPNKGPYAFRRHFAHAAGIPEERVVIEPVAIGGDFGGKGLTVDELPCYFLARATGRPVRYVATYAEELRRGATRHRTSLTLRSAVDDAGTLLAHTSRVVYDGGAYAATKPIPTLLPGNSYGSIPYRVPHVRLDMYGAYTNTLPGAHVRGPGEVQTFFAWEQHMDRMARALAIDPLEFRLRNIVRDGDATLLGETIHHPMAYDVLRTVQASCAPLEAGSGIGRGVSIVCAHTGSGKTGVRMHLGTDGRIEVIIGAVDQGAGLATVVRRVVAAALDIDPERISVRRGNTADAVWDQGSGHSRVTHIVGRAALDAAEQVREALAAGEEAEVIGRFISDHGEQVPGDLTFGALALDVHVDRETGELSIRDALFVMDVGQIINPVAHQGQIDGGFIMGLGAALMEEVTLNEDGKVTTPSLGEYKLPTMRDIPPLRTILLQAPLGDGPFGTRMIGELANVGVSAAVVNAIDDAAGVRLAHFPVRSEDVYAALAAQAR
jgi:CO/xanthine dehydrogenase Mo-binding subunit